MKVGINGLSMGDNTREIMEMYAEAMLRTGAKLEEIARVLNDAIRKISGNAADQFAVFDAAMKAITTMGAAEPLEPQEQVKAPRPHPCPDAGRRHRPKNMRLPRTIQRASIRPQARSTIKQRRNRRRE